MATGHSQAYGRGDPPRRRHRAVLFRHPGSTPRQQTTESSSEDGATSPTVRKIAREMGIRSTGPRPGADGRVRAALGCRCGRPRRRRLPKVNAALAGGDAQLVRRRGTDDDVRPLADAEIARRGRNQTTIPSLLSVDRRPRGAPPGSAAGSRKLRRQGEYAELSLNDLIIRASAITLARDQLKPEAISVDLGSLSPPTERPFVTPVVTAPVENHRGSGVRRSSGRRCGISSNSVFGIDSFTAVTTRPRAGRHRRRRSGRTAVTCRATAVAVRRLTAWSASSRARRGGLCCRVVVGIGR